MNHENEVNQSQHGAANEHEGYAFANFIIDDAENGREGNGA